MFGSLGFECAACEKCSSACRVIPQPLLCLAGQLFSCIIAALLRNRIQHLLRTRRIVALEQRQTPDRAWCPHRAAPAPRLAANACAARARFAGLQVSMGQVGLSRLVVRFEPRRRFQLRQRLLRLVELQICSAQVTARNRRPRLQMRGFFEQRQRMFDISRLGMNQSQRFIDIEVRSDARRRSSSNTGCASAERPWSYAASASRSFAVSAAFICAPLPNPPAPP